MSNRLIARLAATGIVLVVGVATSDVAARRVAAPRISAVHIAHVTWVPGMANTIAFRLSRAAPVQIAVEREDGRGWLRVAVLSVRAAAGSDRVGFSRLLGDRTPPAGRYRASIVARAGGLRSRAARIAFRVVAPPGIAPPGVAPAEVALVPPLGWNSWNTFGCAVSEGDIRRAADALVATGMRDAGYRFVVVDDCWFEPARAADGSLRADPQRFPDGIKALADYVHARGLKFGIYEAPLAKTCAQMSGAIAGATGSLGHEDQDARTFAGWGVDYLKYDYCSPQGTLRDQVATFTKMRDALRATHRPIVYTINPNSDHETTGAAYDWSKIANLWRTTQDVVPLWDREPWYSALQRSIEFDGIVNSLDETAPLTARAGPGHWNDPDMLVAGTQVVPFLAKTFANVPASDTQLLADISLDPTADEMRSQVSMWAILAAPLIAGNDPTSVSTEVRAMLTNREVIAVDQDPLGVAGTPVRKVSDQEVWSKPLTGEAVAVALLNRAQLPATISIDAQTAGLEPAARYEVRDLWSGKQSTTTGTLSAQVPAHGVALLRVGPIG